MADVFSGSFGGSGAAVAPAWRKKPEEAGAFASPAPTSRSAEVPSAITDQPLFKTGQATALENMTAAPAFEAQANEARDALKVAQAEGAKAQREQLMGFGLRDTGAYIDKGIIAPADKAVADRAVLERQLATDRQNIISQRQAAGMSAASSLLGVASQDRALVQDAQQFQSKQDFDKWALDKNLSNDQANRIWQASENTKAQAATAGIASMQNDTERWKTEATAALTKAGWDQENARQSADITAKSNEAALDRAMNKYIADAGFNQEDKKLAMQAAQATDELSFKRWAATAGFDDAAATRAWQTSENSKAQASEEKQNLDKITAAGYQAELDRNFNKWVQEGTWGMEDKKMLQEAAQFDTEENYKRWATGAGIDAQSAHDIWQGAENAKERAQALSIAGQQLYLETQKLTSSIDQFDKTYGLESSKYATGLDEWKAEYNQKVKEYDTATGLEKTKLAQEMQIANNQMNNALTLATLDNEFKLKGISLESVLNNMGSMDPATAADIFVGVMGKAGLDTAGVADKMKAYADSPLPIVFGQEDSPTLQFGRDGSITTPDGSFALADGQSVTLQDNFQTADKSQVVPAGKYTVRYGPVSDAAQARTIELYPADTKNNKTYTVGQWYRGLAT